MNDLLTKDIDDARLDAITRQPLAGFRKVCVAGVRYPYVRVPMREIRQAPTVVEDVIQRGMEEKAAKFIRGGGDVYRNP